MKIKLKLGPNSDIAFLPLKEIIIMITKLESISDEYLRNMRICNLFITGSDRVVKYSLTSSMSKDDQIRYYTRDRLYRSLRSIARFLNSKCQKLEIELYNARYIDEGTKIFIDVLKKFKFKNIKFFLFDFDCENAIRNVSYTEEERNIVDILRGEKLLQDEYEFLIDKAIEYINIGDYITSKNILHFIEKFVTSGKVYSLLATAYTMEGNFRLSEKYLKQWYNYGTLYDKAHSCYSLAMLYARHMNRNKDNDSLAENYLEEGFEILKDIKILDEDALLRDKLFNRNGLALLYFRYDRIEEAIKIETEAIKILDGMSGSVAKLQKSVLLYNLAQCYFKKRDFAKSIDTYNVLLELDPYFTEYHMEQAKNYLELEDFDNAEKFLIQAKDIDSEITEIYSLLGYCYYMQKKYDESIKNYKKASFLDIDRSELLYDYLYVLSYVNKYSEALQVIEKLNLTEDFILKNASVLVPIISEVYFNMGQKDRALSIIDKALKLNPKDENFIMNQKLILENMG